MAGPLLLAAALSVAELPPVSLLVALSMLVASWVEPHRCQSGIVLGPSPLAHTPQGRMPHDGW